MNLIFQKDSQQTCMQRNKKDKISNRIMNWDNKILFALIPEGIRSYI